MATVPTGGGFNSAVATMSHEATLIYSEALLRHAVFSFGDAPSVSLHVALLVGALGLGLSLRKAWPLGSSVHLQPYWCWVSRSPRCLRRHYRNSLRKFRQMDKPRATFRADESRHHEFGHRHYNASMVRRQELWQFRSVWLLLYSKAQFSTLPLACLSPETQRILCSAFVNQAEKLMASPPSNGQTPANRLLLLMSNVRPLRDMQRSPCCPYPPGLRTCPTLTFLLRRTIRDHLPSCSARNNPQCISATTPPVFRACGLASGRTSFASSRRQCWTGS